MTEWKSSRPICRKDCGESGCVYYRASRCAIDAFKPDPAPARVKGGEHRARRAGGKKEPAIIEAEEVDEVDQTPTGEEADES